MGFKQYLKSYRVQIILATFIVFITAFFLTNTHKMILYVANPPNIKNILGGKEIINKFLSINTLKVLLMYLIYGIVVSMFFKDKTSTFFTENEDKKLALYFTKYLAVITSTTIGLFLVFLVKLIVYKKGFYFFNTLGNVGQDSVFMFFFIQLSFALFGCSVVFSANMFFKENLLAVLFPLFFLEVIVLLLGATTIFISEKLVFLKYILSFINAGLVDKLIINTTHDYRIESLPITIQVMIGIVIILFSVLLLLLGYLVYLKVRKDKINENYYFNLVSSIVYISTRVTISYLIAFTISSVLTIFFKGISIEDGKLMFNAILLISTAFFVAFKYYIPKLILDQEVA
ncbi:hypothetical protein CPJCM30710_19990 [Clostridium polyendosporum]|uniref:Uncharacterized protein n=1 Tax=Clostridium polyendosporum TaxID=69208 RepID=A0A919S2E0_9CLOT|nr:hypothetical protein [Clostridium polyendosporum]GIM29333.1 hypothetical protein CPJCM30710_19990 [Clostridium polyendosporum]